MNKERKATALAVGRLKRVLEDENISATELSIRTQLPEERILQLLTDKNAVIVTNEFVAIGDALKLPLDYFVAFSDDNYKSTISPTSEKLLITLLRLDPEIRDAAISFALNKLKEDCYSNPNS